MSKRQSDPTPPPPAATSDWDRYRELLADDNADQGELNTLMMRLGFDRRWLPIHREALRAAQELEEQIQAGVGMAEKIGPLEHEMFFLSRSRPDSAEAAAGLATRGQEAERELNTARRLAGDADRATNYLAVLEQFFPELFGLAADTTCAAKWCLPSSILSLLVAAKVEINPGNWRAARFPDDRPARRFKIKTLTTP